MVKAAQRGGQKRQKRGKPILGAELECDAFIAQGKDMTGKKEETEKMQGLPPNCMGFVWIL